VLNAGKPASHLKCLMNFKKGDYVKLTSKKTKEFAILKILIVHRTRIEDITDKQYEPDLSPEYTYRVIKRLNPYSNYIDKRTGKSLSLVRRGRVDNDYIFDIEVITEDEAKVDML